MNTAIRSVVLLTALGSAVTGGVLFGFSSFVMPALRSLPAAEAVRAMNAVNLAAPRSVFMVPLFVATLGGLLVGGYALAAGPQPGRGWLIAGALGAVATMAITAGYHIPHNNALAATTGDSAGTVWPGWAAGWTALNHLRTATALMSAIALVLGARGGR